MHQLCGYAASLSICLQINIEIRIAVKGGLCHGLFDDIRHLEEATLTLAETGVKLSDSFCFVLVTTILCAVDFNSLHFKLCKCRQNAKKIY